MFSSGTLNTLVIIFGSVKLAVAQSVRAFATHAEDRVFEIPAVTNLNRKTGNNSSTAKRSVTGVSITGPRR